MTLQGAYPAPGPTQPRTVQMMRSKGYYWSPWGGGSYSNTVTWTANGLSYVPFWMDRPGVIGSVCFEVSTGQAGKSVRVGIYTIDSDFQPADRLVDTGDVSVTSTGGKVARIQETKLPAGWLFWCWHSDASTANYVGSSASTSRHVYEINPASWPAANVWLYSRTAARGSYGPLPARGIRWTGASATSVAVAYDAPRGGFEVSQWL